MTIWARLRPAARRGPIPREALVAALGGSPHPGAPGEFIGIEHEYSLSRNGQPLDFRPLIHTLPINGRRLDPGDINAYRLRSGLALTADGLEAELATPPIAVRPGFASEIEAWSALARRTLCRILPPGVEVSGYSTHISVAMPDDVVDAVAERYVTTFAPALALLMEGPGSNGIYVRPRPGRLELCGEFVDGPRLGAVAAFAAGSARACAAEVAGASGRLPELRLAVLPGVERYGFRVHRFAAGFDAYAAGREGRLATLDGRTVSGAALLAAGSESARQALGRNACRKDTALLRAMASGAAPLGVEGSNPPHPAERSAHPSPHELGAVVRRFERPHFAVSAVLATWSFTVFRVAAGAEEAYVSVPRGQLARFVECLTRGRLDALLQRQLESGLGAVLSSHEQTRQAGVFAAVGEPASLLPPERDPEDAVARVAALSARMSKVSAVGGSDPRGPSGSLPRANVLTAAAGAPAPDAPPSSSAPGGIPGRAGGTAPQRGSEPRPAMGETRPGKGAVVPIPPGGDGRPSAPGLSPGVLGGSPNAPATPPATSAPGAAGGVAAPQAGRPGKLAGLPLSTPRPGGDGAPVPLAIPSPAVIQSPGPPSPSPDPAGTAPASGPPARPGKLPPPPITGPGPRPIPVPAPPDGAESHPAAPGATPGAPVSGPGSARPSRPGKLPVPFVPLPAPAEAAPAQPAAPAGPPPLGQPVTPVQPGQPLAPPPPPSPPAPAPPAGPLTAEAAPVRPPRPPVGPPAPPLDQSGGGGWGYLVLVGAAIAAIVAVGVVLAAVFVGGSKDDNAPVTPTVVATATATPTATPSPTASPSRTPETPGTATPTSTNTATPTQPFIPQPTEPPPPPQQSTSTPTRTVTASTTATAGPTLTPTRTATPRPTETRAPTLTPTPTDTPTPTIPIPPSPTPPPTAACTPANGVPCPSKTP